MIKAARRPLLEAPQPQDLIPALFGNPNLTYQRSQQYSLGFDSKLPFDANLEMTAYYKYMYALEAETAAANAMGAPLYLANNGLGRAYGIELLLRRQLMRGLYGWVAYSLSRAERRDDPTEPGYPNWHLYEFDQTHILTVIASYQTEHNWTFGTRLRYVSGDPFTPFVNGIFNANNGSYVCIPGNPDTARVPRVLPGRRARRPPLGLQQVDLHRLPRRPERHQPGQPGGDLPELQLQRLRHVDRAAGLPHAGIEGRILKRARPPPRGSTPVAGARVRRRWRSAARASRGSTATIRS